MNCPRCGYGSDPDAKIDIPRYRFGSPKDRIVAYLEDECMNTCAHIMHQIGVGGLHDMGCALDELLAEGKIGKIERSSDGILEFYIKQEQMENPDFSKIIASRINATAELSDKSNVEVHITLTEEGRKLLRSHDAGSKVNLMPNHVEKINHPKVHVIPSVDELPDGDSVKLSVKPTEVVGYVVEVK